MRGAINILFWRCVFLLGEVNGGVLKVVKYILFVAKAARLVPSFTIFTAKKKKINYNLNFRKM